MPHISNDIFQRISYRKYGNGPAIVLLHGFPEDGNLWRYIHPALSASFTVIVPDLPGSGDSEFSGDNISVAQLAESVQLILEQEQIAGAVIAGHSMGGYVALAFAGKYPEKVKGITMVHSTAEADDEERKKTRRKTVDLLKKGFDEIFIREMVPNLFSTSFKAAHAGVVAEQMQRGLQLEVKSMISYYNAMINRVQYTTLLEEATFPLQWIIGKDDNIVPFQKALQQSHLTNINFVSLYNNSGHMSMLENPVQLTEDMKAFVTYCYNV
jgi:pimeloyl-ACP methyl ester carboxylesterase